MQAHMLAYTHKHTREHTHTHTHTHTDKQHSSVFSVQTRKDGLVGRFK